MSVPIFVETALQMMVPNVDQFMLSRYSQDAVAAVGNDNVVFNMIVLTLAVMCQAATILIAHYRGAGDLSKVNEVCTVAVASNFCLGAVLSGLLFFCGEWFLRLIGVPVEIWGMRCSTSGGSARSYSCRACTWRSFPSSAAGPC